MAVFNTLGERGGCLVGVQLVRGGEAGECLAVMLLAAYLLAELVVT